MHLPKDPLTPATRSQAVLAGIASLIVGISFLTFAALTIQITISSGRIGRLDVLMLIAAIVVISLGFLDAAVAIFRKKEKRRTYLLSSTTLYLIGSFLLVLPIVLLGWTIAKGSEEETFSIMKLLSLSGLGLLALRLAHIRRKKGSTKP